MRQFINRVVDDGIAAAKSDYGPGLKLQGSIAGFEACRNIKSNDEMKDLLEASLIAVEDARNRHSKDYWWFRCYSAEVEWICDCISAAMVNAKLPPIMTPTARAVLKAAEILRVGN